MAKEVEMKRRIYIWTIIVFVIVGLDFYGVHEYFRPNKDMSTLKEVFRVSATVMVHEFEKSDSAAGKKYIGKIIVVTGKIKELEKDEKGYCTLVLGEEGIMSSVRCSVDTLYTKEVAEIRKGNNVSVKGILTGYNADSTGLLGSDVQLSRCIFLHEK
jgi:hypothetical protein